ncbi:P-loop containing nucleoside triphosphate hydrolase protein [Apiospora arundinis]
MAVISWFHWAGTKLLLGETQHCSSSWREFPQIALEAAFRVRDLDAECSVFWVPAVTRATFENAYREIGHALDVPGIQEDKADVTALVRSALNHASAGRWLLIVDNADDTELVFGDTDGPPLLHCLPSSYQGSILFTTRNHEVASRLDVQPTNTFPVGQMSLAEAKQMLCNGLKQSQIDDISSAERLLDFLTLLPLAIKQASAYMMRTGVTTTKYLRYCLSSDEAQTKLLSEDFGDRHRYAEIANPVAATWIISFAHVTEKWPLAAEFLKLICYFAEKDIPVSLLPGDDEMGKDEAIGVLKGYAFIIGREASGSFDIHRLVRLAIRNWIKSQGLQRDRVTTSLKSLASAFPFPKHENRNVWLGYLPHTQTALELQYECADQYVQWRLLFNAAECHSILGKYGEAERLYRSALEMPKKLLGREHPSTLDSMNNLANVLGRQGKYSEAEQMHRQTLEPREKVLGREHPSTLNNIHDLALVLDRQGKYSEAEQIYRQTLELKEKVLGREHPSTLNNINDLANVLGKQGKYSEAEQMHRQTLELREKVLGREHPSTLNSINNLGNELGGQGKYSEAEQMHRQTLELREKVLGREHPSTLNSINNLANVLGRQGKYSEAEQMHRQTLELKEKVLGREHPSTLDSINNLANVLGKQGKYSEAERIQRQTLELREKVLGREHPSTLDNINDLGNVLGGQGKYSEAEQMHRQTLELKEKVLGREHPSTLNNINDLANVLGKQGKYSEAEQMHRQTLELKEKVLGREHPSTLNNINDLANVLGKQGKYSEAEQMHRQTLELKEKVLGREHPSTLNNINDLANVLGKQGKYSEAEQMHRQILELREKVLGREHPETMKSRRNLQSTIDTRLNEVLTTDT